MDLSERLELHRRIIYLEKELEAVKKDLSKLKKYDPVYCDAILSGEIDELERR
jgi:hypothetical protein